MYSRILSLTLLLALFAGTSYAQQSLSFATGGTVKIEGTSNVHGWTCDVKQYAGSVAGDLSGAAPGTLAEATFTVPIAGIECKNGTMNGKLREALKADQHSSIRFALTNARVTPGEGNAFTVAVTGRLTIAGLTQNVQMNVRGEALGGGRYRFVGSVPIAMSDYGLKAPTAMMGAMRTGNTVTVTFDLVAGR